MQLEVCYGEIRNGSKSVLFCHRLIKMSPRPEKYRTVRVCMTKEVAIFLFIAIVVEVIHDLIKIILCLRVWYRASLPSSDTGRVLVPIYHPTVNHPRAGIIYAILVWVGDCSYWIDRCCFLPKTGCAGYYWHVAYHLRRCNRKSILFSKSVTPRR